MAWDHVVVFRSVRNTLIVSSHNPPFTRPGPIHPFIDPPPPPPLILSTGLRIDAQLNARSRMSHYTRLSIVTLAPGVTLPLGDAGVSEGGKETPVTGVPEGAAINFVTWNNAGTAIAFTVRGTGEPGCALARGPLSLWVADVETGAARQVLTNLNTLMDEHFFLDDDTLGALIIPPGRGPPPLPRRHPARPPHRGQLARGHVGGADVSRLAQRRGRRGPV